MKKAPRSVRAALLVAALAAAPAAAGQSVSEIDPHARVTATASPPRIRIEWAAMPNTMAFSVLRREEGASAWDTVAASLPGDSTSFDDTNVMVGRAYEYTVRRRATDPSIVQGNAYLLAGVEVPFREDQGAVVVVVDRASSMGAAMELDRLYADLEADGWTVVREVVDATATPPAVRARIIAARTAHGERLRAVLLLGAVPRAFSGVLNPDGHPDHRGAWPADSYYGDVDGEWTDEAALGGEGSFVNNAGDGKFDQTQLPSPVELAVGRVDTADMPAFTGLDAAALLRRYLDHDHAWRVGQVQVRARGYVSDNFGYFSGEAFARPAWRDTAALFGTEPDSGRPFFDALEDPAGGYAFALGCGGGNPTGAGGVGSTADFVTRSPRAVYLGLFGSYFGDWAYQNNFMRAAILSQGTALVTSWFARPSAHFHHLGALRSFGDAFLATVNNTDDYDAGSGRGGVHQALLGDPTLRMFVTRAPTELAAAPSPAGIALRWTASPDASAGYHVYRRAAGATTAATRLTTTPVTAAQYLDATASAGVRVSYRVVAVQRVTTGSGTFFNHSPGAVIDAAGVPAQPDAGVSGTDGGRRDGGATGDAGTNSTNAGCGCHTPGNEQSRSRARAPLFVAALGAVAALARRRRA